VRSTCSPSECGVADLVPCGCLPYISIVNVTKRLNGGLNGLAERCRQLVLWKAELHVSS